MKKLMLLFFGLFFAVAGFGFEGERNEVCLEDICVEMEFTGGDVDIIQGFDEVQVVVTNNEGYSGSITVLDGAGKVVFYEGFDNDAFVVIDISNYPADDYKVVAVAGSNVESLIFNVR